VSNGGVSSASLGSGSADHPRVELLLHRVDDLIGLLHERAAFCDEYTTIRTKTLHVKEPFRITDFYLLRISEKLREVTIPRYESALFTRWLHKKN